MITDTERETREFNYQRHGILCNFIRLTTEQSKRIKRSFEYHWGDREESSCTGINLFVGGSLLTIKSPSPDHNFIEVVKPSAEALYLFKQEQSANV